MAVKSHNAFAQAAFPTKCGVSLYNSWRAKPTNYIPTDASCSDPMVDGTGCHAGGHKNCRFCGHTNAAGEVTGVRAYNTHEFGCTHLPYHACNRICTLTVRVPDGAPTTFVVYQAEEDVGQGEPLVSVAPGTRIATLSMGAWWRRPPSASLHVDGATLSTLDANLGAGHVRVRATSVSSRRGGQSAAQRSGSS